MRMVGGISGYEGERVKDGCSVHAYVLERAVEVEASQLVDRHHFHGVAEDADRFEGREPHGQLLEVDEHAGCVCILVDV